MRHLDVLSYDLCLDPCCTWDLLSPYTDRNLKGTVLSTRCICFPDVLRKEIFILGPNAERIDCIHGQEGSAFSEALY